MAAPSPRPDAFIARFLARMPADVAASFTPAQLQAVERAFGMRYAVAHAIDLRRRIRLPWGRYYLVLLFGRDTRAEGDRPGPRLFVACVLLGLCALLGVA
jgi:hypothetical protein